MRTRLGGLAAVAALVTSGLTGSALADPGEVPAPGSRADVIAQDARADQATAALTEVAAIFGDTPAGLARAAARSAHGHEATLALRDLALLMGSLTGAERVAAERYLARPDGGQVLHGVAYETRATRRSCSTNVCIHYVRTTTDKVPLADPNGNGVPDYVDFARGTMQMLHASYKAAGFRSPKRDGLSRNDGGDGRPDVYLADMPNDLFGFCTSDDPHISGGSYPYFDVSAYCVLDNDYSSAEYGTDHTRNELFQITAAHEYFHAVQFAYDVTEDGWFMEGTATWVEDEMFDDVNDNLVYLSNSPIAQPSISLDTREGLRVYGSWAYFRHLSEAFPAPELGGIPTIIRDIWKLADASKAGFADGIETFSADAVRDAVVARGGDFPTGFSRFAANNREPSLNYEEGATWPTAPLWTSSTLEPTALTSSLSRQLDHLSSATARFTPSGLTQEGWQLRLTFNLPDKFRGSAATVKVYGGGVIDTSAVPLDASGGAVVDVPFSTATTDHVEVTLTNASVRFRLATCYSFKTSFSCGGAVPSDDSLVFSLSATAMPPA